MGLFDQVLGGALNGLGGNAGGNGLQDVIMQLINNPKIGGLEGLVKAFQSGGLGEIVNSWVGTGQNLPVSPEQLESAIGSEQLSAVASQLGISQEQAGGQLAELLPKVVDLLTPNGQLPQGGDLMAQGLELLKGKFLG
ncbi:YidB family protein [Dechloromonas sp. A34]|uniref:YidB family protein n=1 Tax=Dechloromonas sp. A34 TaxID=447588 RepID=UPI0022489208|nr:YidB family protein [Dechloromonas sp. A34]